MALTIHLDEEESSRGEEDRYFENRLIRAYTVAATATLSGLNLEAGDTLPDNADYLIESSVLKVNKDGGGAVVRLVAVKNDYA